MSRYSSCALKWPARPTKVNAGKSFGAELGQFIFLTRPCSTVSKWTGSYIHLFTPIPALVSVLNCSLCNTHTHTAMESNLGLVSCPSRLEQSVVEPAAFWLVDDLAHHTPGRLFRARLAHIHTELLDLAFQVFWFKSVLFQVCSETWKQPHLWERFIQIHPVLILA